MANLLLAVAGLIVVIAVPATGWVVNRLSKAHQMETHDAINTAMERFRKDLVIHIDGQVSTVNERITDLARAQRASADRMDETRQELAHLKGRFEERQQIQVGAPL